MKRENNLTKEKVIKDIRALSESDKKKWINARNDYTNLPEDKKEKKIFMKKMFNVIFWRWKTEHKNIQKILLKG